MYALEPEPEQKQRWKRLAVGGLVAVLLATGTLFAAKNVVAPMRRLLPDVLQLAVIDEPPPPLPTTPPPPPPPPPPPKKQPEPKPEDEVKAAEEKVEEKPDEASAEPDVGLDAESFGGNGSGLAFRAGTTQMGDPNRPDKPTPVVATSTKLRPARALNPVAPKYPERARRLNLEGDVLLEVDIDARGKLTNIRVKQGLGPELDRVAVAAVKNWRFEPATLAGQATSSTGILRFKFSLV